MKTRDEIKGRILAGFRTVYKAAEVRGDKREMNAVMARIKHDAEAVKAVTGKEG